MNINNPIPLFGSPLSAGYVIITFFIYGLTESSLDDFKFCFAFPYSYN